MTILEDTARLVEERLGDALGGIHIERAVLGLFFTGVKLSNGSGGICFTPVKDIPEAVCCPSSAGRIFKPETLQGLKAEDILSALPSSEPLKVAVAVATLNALSSLLLFGEQENGYSIKTGMDALDAVDPQKASAVSVVGAIIPALRMLKGGDVKWWVIEEDARTLKEDEISHYVSFSNSEEQIKESDLLIITGVTLYRCDSFEPHPGMDPRESPPRCENCTHGSYSQHAARCPVQSRCQCGRRGARKKTG